MTKEIPPVFVDRFKSLIVIALGTLCLFLIDPLAMGFVYCYAIVGTWLTFKIGRMSQAGFHLERREKKK